MRNLPSLLEIHKILGRHIESGYIQRFKLITAEEKRVIFSINAKRIKFLFDDRGGYVYRSDASPWLKKEVFFALRDYAEVLMWRHNAELKRAAREKKQRRLAEEARKEKPPVQLRLL